MSSLRVAAVGFGLFVLLLPQFVTAQGIVYLSNLGETSTASAAVGSDSWIAQSFFSGTNTAGYVLNSIQLLMGAASGNPTGFTVSIYSSSLRVPNSSVGSLDGVDPATGGIFTYTSSGITLSPFTLYFVILTATTPVADGSYSWSRSSNGNYTFSERWEMGDFYYSSTDGSNWTVHHFVNPFQFAVDATAVPEPETVSLLMIGFGLAAGLRRPQR